MEDNINVVFVRTSIRSDLLRIRDELREIAEKEAICLFRLARRMKAHGCSAESITAVREEAWLLQKTMRSYPERLIEDNTRWKYAFKI